MKDLNYSLKTLCRDNRDGSYSTQATRRRILDRIANQLHELGYRRMTAQSLKPKHIEALVSSWKDQGISIGTFKNRLSALRWWARKVRKEDIMAKDNMDYGVGRRDYVPKESKAQRLDTEVLSRVTDPYTKLSLQLQEQFGLRREEAIKFSPSYAVKDDHIRLKASWSKGGRARTVPICTDQQRQLLEAVRNLAKGGALIAPHLNYAEQRNRYDAQVRMVGIKNPHGLRHAYAQQRYKTLTGWKAPVAGGPATKSFTPEQRALDEGARETISRELGHNREEVTKVYLGR